MEPLQNKIDFALIFSVDNANPNGDPLGGNRPRTNLDGFGEVSDVALKRKIRNRLQDEHEKIFVQMQDRQDEDDYFASLAERFKDFKKNFKGGETHIGREKLTRAACEKWIDVRSFGQVFAYASGKKNQKNSEGDTGQDSVSIGVRGPVTIQSAFSTSPVVIEDKQITKSVNGDTVEGSGKSADTMGMKYCISGRAIYVTKGSISPQLAEKTGFSAEDAEKIKNALLTLFVNDESSARPAGSMEVLKVVWFTHDCKAGQYSSAKAHRAVKVNDKGEVSVDTAEIPGLKYEILDGQ